VGWTVKSKSYLLNETFRESKLFGWQCLQEERKTFKHVTEAATLSKLFCGIKESNTLV